MITAIDTNILLDLLTPGAKFSQRSKQLLDESYRAGSLIICEVVYAELAAQFKSQVELEEFLKDTGIRLVNSDSRALYEASLAWKVYAKRRGRKLQCPSCGQTQEVRCTKCNRVLSFRQHILGDFLVGSHALCFADRLLSRDRGYYRRCFPKLRVLSPGDKAAEFWSS